MTNDAPAPARRYTPEEVAAEYAAGRVRWTEDHNQARTNTYTRSTIAPPRNRDQKSDDDRARANAARLRRAAAMGEL